MGKGKPGRKRGGRKKGYYYRKGRGWFANEGRKPIPLVDINGQRVREKDCDPAVVKEAYQRHLIAKATKEAADISQVAQAAQVTPTPATVTLVEVCDAYLAHVAATGAKATHYNRANTLFDLCNALPARYRPKNGGVPTPELREAAKRDRCQHPPYGGLPAARLTPLHVDAWLNAHPTWKTSRRSRIQALKRALNYAVERHMLAENPIANYKVGKSRGRITYFTPEQEAALLKHAHLALAMALKVCIRTGLRYGIEFVPLTAKQVVDLGDRMEWRVTPKRTKVSQRFRLVRVADPAIIALTREQIKKHPEGPIFRNESGNPWIADNLTVSFTRLRRRVEAREGIQFDPDACMNTCRHTFAKRTLQGYWSGKPTTIETLARLMGNTPQVCWDHYVQWCDAYNEALWEAVTGQN